MVFRRFDFRLIILILLTSVTGALFFWLLGREYMRATTSGLFIIWVLQIAYLIYYLNRIRRDLERVFSAMRNQDTGLAFPTKKTDPFFRKLHYQFNALISDFRLVRKEREQEHQFFMHTIQHIKIGIMAFDKNGDINITNKALNELFNLLSLKHVSQLRYINSNLPDRLLSMEPGDQFLMKLHSDNQAVHLSVMASQFIMDRRLINLISFQDISREIDKNEVEAWQKLIRVLTHEIMNSISPLHLLSAGLLKTIKPGNNKQDKIVLEGETLENTLSGLESIKKRSQGLTDFVDSYRTLTKIPEPKRKPVLLSGLFKETRSLFSEELNQNGIEFSIQVEPEDLKILADEQLIIQVLINLVKNAIQALEDTAKPLIRIKGYSQKETIVIEVNDNGHGIPENQIESVFIPFYTTREKGSGIGLSLSRQIMHLHNGRLQVQSTPDKGSSFKMYFI